MAYVIAAPEMMTAAATDLATIASNVSAAHMVAAAPTTSVIPAAADEVSTGIAQLFSQHAQGYQALAGQATAFHEQFVQNLTASAGSFAHAEAANVALLQPLTAIEGSFTSGIAKLPSALPHLFNTVIDIVAFVADPADLLIFPLLLPFVLPILAADILGAITNPAIILGVIARPLSTL